MEWTTEEQIVLRNGLSTEFICGVIKQNESEVGDNMLLVSKVLFHLNICM